MKKRIKKKLDKIEKRENKKGVLRLYVDQSIFIETPCKPLRLSHISGSTGSSSTMTFYPIII